VPGGLTVWDAGPLLHALFVSLDRTIGGEIGRGAAPVS